jgi:hypothetical protein
MESLAKGAPLLIVVGGGEVLDMRRRGALGDRDLPRLEASAARLCARRGFALSSQAFPPMRYRTQRTALVR